MAWVSPIFPRADRPELLRYYLSAIIYLLSIPYYGPHILVHFLQAFLAIFRNFPCQNQPGEMPECTTFASPQKHRVRMSKFFHIFVRNVSKTSFSALNWRVAVRMRGEPFLWDNFHDLAFRWHRAAKTSIFSAIPIGIAAFWPGYDRDPAFPIPSHSSIKNHHEKA